MNDTVERFKARRALYGEFTQSPIHPDVLESPSSAMDRDELLSSVALQLDDPRQLPQMDPDTLLGEIREGLEEKHFEALVDSCKRECLQAVIRPFGIARVLFKDKEGGNVDTVHNVRTQSKDKNENLRFIDKNKKEFTLDKNGKYYYTDGSAVHKDTIKGSSPVNVYATESERRKYNSEMDKYESDKKSYKEYMSARKEYTKAYNKWESEGKVGDPPVEPVSVQDPKHKYRCGNKNFRDKKKEYAKEKASGNLVDPTTGENFSQDDVVHVDHAHPCESIETDPARVLAEIINGPELANIQENLNPMLGHVNQSKNDLSAEAVIARWKSQEPKRLKDIKILKEMQEKGLTSLEQDLHLKHLQQLQNVSEKELTKIVEKGKGAIDKIIMKKYYMSGKFIKNAAVTSLNEGGKMGVQQAFGALMEEFVLAAFDEVKDAWKNGFKARVDDSFLAALKERLMRVVARVLAKWRDALTAFKDGFISGFLSNLVTVIINMFFTTSARLVRVIREGFMSLYRALKLLICPPEGMSFAEAADAATKLLAAGCVTGVGVMLEQWIEKSLLFLGPLAPYASTIVSALVTGLGTVFVTYMLERLDLFGVQAKSRHDEVMTKLNEMVCISHEKALEDSAVFSEPALLHLT